MIKKATLDYSTIIANLKHPKTETAFNFPAQSSHNPLQLPHQLLNPSA